jgi:uncharacterized coiled-coil DUF342 family protein
MSGLREIIEKRRNEVRQLMEPLEATALEQRKNLNATEAKLRALAKEAAEIEKALQAIGQRERREATVTIKEAILQVLGEADAGMTSSEILTAINERFFAEQGIPRTSMSPQLTRLKNDDHKIKRRGERYFLA